MVDYAFLTLLVVILLPVVLFLFRNRLLGALTRLILQNGTEMLNLEGEGPIYGEGHLQDEGPKSDPPVSFTACFGAAKRAP